MTFEGRVCQQEPPWRHKATTFGCEGIRKREPDAHRHVCTQTDTFKALRIKCVYTMELADKLVKFEENKLLFWITKTFYATSSWFGMITLGTPETDANAAMLQRETNIYQLSRRFLTSIKM